MDDGRGFYLARMRPVTPGSMLPSAFSKTIFTTRSMLALSTTGETNEIVPLAQPRRCRAIELQGHDLSLAEGLGEIGDHVRGEATAPDIDDVDERLEGLHAFGEALAMLYDDPVERGADDAFLELHLRHAILEHFLRAHGARLGEIGVGGLEVEFLLPDLLLAHRVGRIEEMAGRCVVAFEGLPFLGGGGDVGGVAGQHARDRDVDLLLLLLQNQEHVPLADTRAFGGDDRADLAGHGRADHRLLDGLGDTFVGGRCGKKQGKHKLSEHVSGP